jgi:hypothetical protein
MALWSGSFVELLRLGPPMAVGQCGVRKVRLFKSIRGQGKMGISSWPKLMAIDCC